MEETVRDKISREVVDGFNKVTTTISTTVTGTVRDIVGPELQKLMDFAKDLASGAWNWIKATGMSAMNLLGFGMGVSDELKEEKKQTGYLGWIKDYFRREERRRDREMPEEEKGNLTIIGLLGALLGLVSGSIAAIAGGIIANFLIPFRIFTDFAVTLTRLTTKFLSPVIRLFSALGRVIAPFFRPLTSLIRVFTPLGKVISYLAGHIGNVMAGLRKVLDAFTKLGGMTTKLIQSTSPFLRTFGRVIRLIPVIGWGITFIMGIIDFFRGFKSESGGLLDKIKAGLIEVIMGFFDPVFRVFGWLADKILGWFGIEIEGGSGEAAMNFVREKLEQWWGFLISIITGAGNLIKNVGIWIKDNWDKVVAVWNIAKAAITRDWDALGERVQNMIQGIKNTIQGIFDYLMLPINAFIIDPVKNLIEWFKNTPDHSKWDKVLDIIYKIIQKVFDSIMYPFDKFILGPIESLISWLGTLQDTKLGAAVSKVTGFFKRGDKTPGPEELTEEELFEDNDLFKELVDINRELLEIEKYKMSLLRGQQESMSAEERAHQEQMLTKMRREAIPLPTDGQTNIVSSNQNVMTGGGGQRSSEREAPDEVEHIGMLLMTNSTLGPAM